MPETEYRALLFSVAYRMLGSAADAEDMVQEAFERYRRADTSAVESPKSYLTTIVTRLCIDHLRSARVRRERLTDTGTIDLPEPIAGFPDDLTDSLSIAFLVILRSLAPTERAVFLLREVFGYSYQTIAEITGKSQASCRQLARRARERVASRRPRFRASRETVVQIIAEFTAAIEGGNLDRLLEILAPDVTLYTDGGSYGRARAIAKPLHGASAVARFLVAIQAQAPSAVAVQLREVNGAPTLLAYIDDTLISAIAFEVDDDRIRELFIIGDAKKLARLAAERWDA